MNLLRVQTHKTTMLLLFLKKERMKSIFVTSCLVNMARKKMKNQNKIMKLTDKKKNKLLKKNVLIQLSFEDFLFKKL